MYLKNSLSLRRGRDRICCILPGPCGKRATGVRRDSTAAIGSSRRTVSCGQTCICCDGQKKFHRRGAEAQRKICPKPAACGGQWLVSRRLCASAVKFAVFQPAKHRPSWIGAAATKTSHAPGDDLAPYPWYIGSMKRNLCHKVVVESASDYADDVALVVKI
jgi:hypothetical protein